MEICPLLALNWRAAALLQQRIGLDMDRGLSEDEGQEKVLVCVLGRGADLRRKMTIVGGE